MFCSFLMRRGRGSRRLIGTVLFLAVFFLPLHFHSFTLTSQISKECSCYHGGRTQVGLTPVTDDWSPIFQPFFLTVYEAQALACFSVNSHTIRAPPAIYPL